jgi:hypothetical protein
MGKYYNISLKISMGLSGRVVEVFGHPSSAFLYLSAQVEQNAGQRAAFDAFVKQSSLHSSQRYAISVPGAGKEPSESIPYLVNGGSGFFFFRSLKRFIPQAPF